MKMLKSIICIFLLVCISGIVYAYLNVDLVIEYRDSKNTNKNIIIDNLVITENEAYINNKIDNKNLNIIENTVETKIENKVENKLKQDVIENVVENNIENKVETKTSDKIKDMLNKSNKSKLPL